MWTSSKMMIKFMLMIAMVGHWLGCAWALLHSTVCDAQCTEERGATTWLLTWLEANPSRPAGHMPSSRDFNYRIPLG